MSGIKKQGTVSQSTSGMWSEMQFYTSSSQRWLTYGRNKYSQIVKSNLVVVRQPRPDPELIRDRLSTRMGDYLTGACLEHATSTLSKDLLRAIRNASSSDSNRPSVHPYR